MKDNRVFKRGDIYYANLNPYRGSEQGGNRPVLILQNNAGNFFSSTLIIAPMTSRIYKKQNMPTHYVVEQADGLKQPSVVQLEQIRTIDKCRVSSFVGRVGREDMREIDDCIRTSLDLWIPEDEEPL